MSSWGQEEVWMSLPALPHAPTDFPQSFLEEEPVRSFTANSPLPKPPCRRDLADYGTPCPRLKRGRGPVWPEGWSGPQGVLSRGMLSLGPQLAPLSPRSFILSPRFRVSSACTRHRTCGSHMPRLPGRGADGARRSCMGPTGISSS